MSCAYRNSLSKEDRNQRKFRPPGIFRGDRPDTCTYKCAIFLQEQRDTFIRLQSEANISDSVGGPGRHNDQAENPQASAQIVKWGNHPPQRHCGALISNVGETEGQGAPEAGHPASPGPPGLGVHASELSNRQTDIQEGSGAVHGRSAARPHLVASRLPASRGS